MNLVGKVGTIEIRYNDKGELRLWCLPGVQQLEPGDVGILIETLREAQRKRPDTNGS